MAERAIFSPYDQHIVGSVPISVREDAEKAIIRAQLAFEKTRRLPSHEKHRILRAIESGIAERREEFARGITDESGKPIRDARAEVDRAMLVFSLAADEARRQGGDLLPLDMNPASNGRIGLTKRFPIGLIAGITPFNFPLNLVAHKLAPAIAAGCPLILKPAEKTPLTALRLSDVVAESGLPKGAFSVLTPESPAETGEIMATDHRFAALSFTGADKIGWELKAKANHKKVILELGGNAAVIIEPDADLAFSVARCAVGSFANAGQVCISIQRIFIHDTFFQEWADAFVTAVSKLKTGDPHEETTDVGPMITESACQKALENIQIALQGGAKALLAGERLSPTLLTPTILTDTQPSMSVCADEAFAPIVVIERYHNFEEALRRVNESRFGLQAGIFTKSIGKIFQAFDVIEAGGIIGNDIPQYRVDNMPYGGVKDSGFGREGVRYAIEEMTELRLLALNLTAPEGS
jgi:glyceraldehyde-3-phosphate dehydrogenase (NADP+)